MIRLLRSVILLGLWLAVPLVVQAQLTKNWEFAPGAGGGYHWLAATGGSNVSLVYNKKTDHLLIANRATRVYIVNPTTGAVLDSLKDANTVGSFKFQRIRVDDNGVIYSSAMVTGAGTYNIYRWASETDTATLAASFAVTARTGDSFAVVDTGVNTTIFASGSSNTNIYKITTVDGKNFTQTGTITVASGLARGSISPVTNSGSSDFWVNGAGTSVTHISNTGTTINTVSGGLIASGWQQVRYFTAGSKKLIAIIGKNDVTDGPRMQIWDVTASETTPTKLGDITQTALYNTNANATGEVDIKYGSDGSITAFAMITNNAVAAYKVSPILVRFNCNSVAVKDTIRSSSTLTVTGNKITSWGAGVPLTNIGGDYWSGVVALTPGDTVKYKYRVNNGWEDGGDHTLIVGTNDSTMALMFYNATGGNQADNWRPWGTVHDSIRVVYFRVNMVGYTSKAWNPGTDQVGVRGDRRSGPGWGLPEFQWGTTHYLTRESTTGMGSYIYSGAVLFSKNVTLPGDSGGYKFIINDDWGRSDAGDRQFYVPAAAETTLAWVWFNNEAPITRDNTDSVTVNFVANMTTATNRQSFVLGDTVAAEAGYFSTADSVRKVYLVKQGGTQNYAGQLKLKSKIGAMLDYQYYFVKDTVLAVREYYFNFGWSGVVPAEQERRQILLSSATQTVTDNVVSVTDPRRQPYFPNQKKLARSVTVKWEVNLKPAYYAVKAGKTLVDGQGSMNVTTVDSIKPWGVAMSGPTQTLVYADWPSWGRALTTVDTVSQMWDDGTHGDAVANDTIYTRVTVYDTARATSNLRGKYFKFGVGGGDNESGFGLNHLENIDDTNPTYTLHTQFGSINPNFYTAWDYTNERPAGTTGVGEMVIPAAYSLSQNFPNPFNPTTKIEFALPVQSQVSLRVYNVLGQLVTTIVDGVMNAGTHSVTFNAARLSSGIYFYRIDAGNFTSLKKMVILK